MTVQKYYLQESINVVEPISYSPHPAANKFGYPVTHEKLMRRKANLIT
ncbi:MAG: hypothetical protein U0103_10865 [Candidatus Obscuribacterales bacterium]|nr:hypothetical protein [Cyanobacteria bacterium SZAS LIN-5]